MGYSTTALAQPDVRWFSQAQRRRLAAILLVVPATGFLALFFVAPLLYVLARGVADPEVSRALPETTAALRTWSGDTLPAEAAGALVADLSQSQTALLGAAGRRLSYEDPAYRGVLAATARRLRSDSGAGSAMDRLCAADPRWCAPAVWQAIRRSAGPLTSRYLATALGFASGSGDAGPSGSTPYLMILARTFGTAGAVALLCAVLGFPVASLLASARPAIRAILMVVVLLPFWTSVLVRTAAWVVLLQRNGVVNRTLEAVGAISTPLSLIYNEVGVVIALTHVLLPYLILPLYGAMAAVPSLQMRAASSLGARSIRVFFTVYLPQVAPGLAAGSLLVFILALGYYITPLLIGGVRDQTISGFVAAQVLDAGNWGLAAALGTVLLAATLVLYGIYSRILRGSSHASS